MGIELLVAKSEEIINSLPTDKVTSKKMTKLYQEQVKDLEEEYKYFSPTYHKNKSEPVYINC